ncbi:MAG TPA: hypothetical protein VFA50_23265 [Stellaceae bacterium]|nr:hypothetical protein [Stellaceae bacterium]
MEFREDISPSIYRFPEFLRYHALRLRRACRAALRASLAQAIPPGGSSTGNPAQQILGAWSLAGIVALLALGIALIS